MTTKFSFHNFSCDVDVFRHCDDIMLRFYDGLKEQKESDINNCVIVDSGYGFLCLKQKGSSALLSGYLNEDVFRTGEMIDAAIELLENLVTEIKNKYVPYHIDCVKFTGFSEYNGEYESQQF